TPEGLAIADLDGDRVADLAVADASHDTVAVFPGRGDASFGAPAALAVGRLPVFLAVGDISGDGRPDLAVANVDGGTVSVLVGRGDGTFDAQLLLRAGSEPLPVVMADLDGDGGLDIAAGNAGDQTISILMNTSERDTAAPEIVSLVASPEARSQTGRGFVPVSITAVATDDCDVAPSCRIVSVTGERHTGRVDSILTDPGPESSPAELAVLLRAGPAGPVRGRSYTIEVSCGDAAGNEVTGRTVVTVASRPIAPHRF
ncbi:MAG TPA: VCBS repeat-containing protein, partial [Candidatus Polarisedimenticolaceae bacterium]|nr:VCBS repeat-containing protein [Candidatus Polarisedimenticolaceae bacterium]